MAIEINDNEIKTLETNIYNYKEPIEIDKELECMICLLPLVEPVVEPHCRQMFCKECLTNWSMENGHKGCPYCQQSFSIDSVSLPPKFVTNTLDGLLVYCNTQGCEFNSDRNQFIRRCDYRNHFERICKVICVDCNQPFTREQLKLHSNECLSKSVKCNANSLMCLWVGPIKELKSHELNCHYVALSPILNKLYDKIQQLEISNQKTTSFLLEKINYLESMLPTTMASSSSTTPNSNSPMYYQPIPTAPLSETIYDTATTTTTTAAATTISLNKTPVEIKKVPSIEIFKNNSFKYVIGKVGCGIKSVSLDENYVDTWPIVKGNLPNSVDTLILLDGFKELVHSIPKSIKTLHVGDIKKSHAFYMESTVGEIHFHDNCKIKFTKNVIPESAKTVHFYNICEPLTTESIGKNVKCLHVHDGFSKSLGYGVLPSSIQELHLYNIKRQALSIPNSTKILYLHNQFNNESIELPDQLEVLYLDNIVHPIKVFPTSLKTIHIINYKFEDEVPFPPKVKIIMGSK
ncbi:hypothetical protein ACTA71_012446 [Dictyostelium dimigraforme]